MSRALLASVAAAAVAASASEMSLRMPQAQAPYGDAGAITGHATGLDGQNGRMLQANPLVTVAAPPLGSSADVTGSVSGLPSAPSNFKVGILVSPDGTTWWDKTHDYPAGVPNTNPIEGIMLTGSGTFDIMGWVSSPNDPTCTYIRVVLVPQSFSFLWPAYQVEGVAWPTNFYNPSTTTAMTTVNRATGAVTNWLPSDGTGLPAVPNGAAPPVSPPAASPAASVAASSAASPAAAAASSQPASGGNPLVTVAAPPLGSSADVTGSVSGLPSAPSNFKVGILVSPDGTTWWDKTHDYPAGVPNTNPIEGIMLTGSGTFDIMGWVSSPNDPTCTYIRVVLVPQSFSFLWPAYQVEGVAWPTNFFNPSTTTAMTTVNRATGAVTNWLPSDGTGVPAVPNGAAAAPSPAASVAASPAAAASPSSAPAAASPSSAAAAPSSASQPSATSNALPNGGASSSPVVSNVPAASPSGAAQTPVASGAGGTHAAVSALLGSLAAAVAGVALLA